MARKRLTDAQVEGMAQGAALGHSCARIARDVGCTAMTVQRYIGSPEGETATARRRDAITRSAAMVAARALAAGVKILETIMHESKRDGDRIKAIETLMRFVGAVKHEPRQKNDKVEVQYKQKRTVLDLASMTPEKREEMIRLTAYKDNGSDNKKRPD